MEKIWTRDDVFSAIYTGMPIVCSEAQHAQIDAWLAECAAYHAEYHDGLRAFIALNERKRLAELFQNQEA